MIKEGWEAIIGMEIHAQLATSTKIFCGCAVKTGAEPNTNTCPTPGSVDSRCAITLLAYLSTS